MAKNNISGNLPVIIIGVVIIMVLTQQGSTPQVVWTNPTLSDCNSERQDEANQYSGRCIGSCQLITQNIVTCFANSGRSGEINNNDLGDYGYFSYTTGCSSLPPEKLLDYNCMYNTPTTEQPNLGAGEPNVEIVNKQVQGAFPITNTGGDMTTDYIIEMQVVPEGTSPQAVIGDQSTCNPTYPNNVHRSFRLARQETVTFGLATPALTNGLYDIYVTTATKCWNVEPLGNQPVAPWMYNQFIGTVLITDDQSCTNNYEICNGDARMKCVNNEWQLLENCNTACVEQGATYTYCTPEYTYYCTSGGAQCTSLSTSNPTPPSTCYTTLAECQTHLGNSCDPADTDNTRGVSFSELVAYATKWKNQQGVTFNALIVAAGNWKAHNC